MTIYTAHWAGFIENDPLGRSFIKMTCPCCKQEYLKKKLVSENLSLQKFKLEQCVNCGVIFRPRHF